jgi:hypothetical protein
VRRDALAPLFAFLLVSTLPRTVVAQPGPRIETHVASACATSARELEPRLEKALGHRARSLVASVSIDGEGAAYRVTIATGDASSSAETTVLVAPTCEEAVDATVEVLALAFSAESQTPEAPARAAPAVEEEDAPLVEQMAPARPRVDDGAASTKGGSSANEPVTRAAFTMGADVGTLPQPTATLGVGVSRSLSELELAALVRYGLPVVEETVETGLVETDRRDFGALELRACYGAGTAIHVAACAGAEVFAVRVTRSSKTDDVDVDEDVLSPGLAGTLVAHLSHRAGIVEPEVEIGGAALALGRDESAPRLALRVAAGASIEF